MQVEFLRASVKDGNSLYHGETLIVDLDDEYDGRLCVFVGSRHFLFKQQREVDATDPDGASHRGPWRYFDENLAEIFFE